MKILVIGFLALFSWSTLSSYIYVCRIKGLCYEPKMIQIVAVNNKKNIVGDTLRKPLVQEQLISPEDMVIYFAFDKSEFNPDASTNNYFDESNAYMGQNPRAVLNISGHTDATGTDEYNHALGYRRAQRLQQYFESKGLHANKITIESKGEKEPAADNNTEAGRANNRRTVLTIKK